MSNRQAARWRQPDVEPEPAAIGRLRDAVGHLRLAAYPHVAGGWASGSRTTGGGFAGDALDPAREPARRALRRIVAKIDRLANEAMEAATGEYRELPRGWRCECGAGQRPGAAYCDRCGGPRPDDA